MEGETLPVTLYQRNKALVGGRSFGGNMRVGDLVRHIVHTDALGIITSTSSTLPEVKVRWLIAATDEYWMLTQWIEIVDE
jgi:hypothetical protein